MKQQQIYSDQGDGIFDALFRSDVTNIANTAYRLGYLDDAQHSEMTASPRSGAGYNYFAMDSDLKAIRKELENKK